MSIVILAFLVLPVQEGEALELPVFRESKTFQETWDESGGIEFLFQPSRVGKDRKFKQDLVGVAYERVASTGAAHFLVTFLEDQRLHILLAKPSARQSRMTRSLFRNPGRLQEREVASREIHEQWDGTPRNAPKGWFAIKNDRKMSDNYDHLGGDYILVSNEVIITNTDFEKTVPEQGPSTNRWAVRYVLTKEGSDRFDRAAEKLYNQSPKGLCAIIMDGKIISKPVVMAKKFGGTGVITGRFSKKDAERLALAFRTCSLPCDLQFWKKLEYRPEPNKKLEKPDRKDLSTHKIHSSPSREIWLMDPKEIRWAIDNFESEMKKCLTVSPPENGLQITKINAGSVGISRGLKNKDILRSVNGHSMKTLADIKKMQNDPRNKRRRSITMVIQRSGRNMVLEYRSER